ncbi:MAG: hypothetical protein M1826_003512 [Phylliscum demangeonii]|nr:MAG: hypothetical protein M1826_003512 [Phylliscum demangeonii]
MWLTTAAVALPRCPMMVIKSPLPLVLLLLVSAARRTVAQASNSIRCYFPNGSLDRKGFPCNVTAAMHGDGTSCCDASDECYTAGTCFAGWSGVTYRGSCTDASFKSNNCPMVTDGKPWIQSCLVQKGIACCLPNDFGGSCCPGSVTDKIDTSATPLPTFTWKPGKLVAVLDGNGNNYLGEYISSGAKPSATATVTSSGDGSMSAAPTACAATATVTAIPLGGASNVAAVTACAPAAPSGSQASSSSSGLSAGQRVGLGVGIPLGVLTAAGLLGLAWLLHRLRRERAERREAEAGHEKTAAAYERELLKLQQALLSPPPPFTSQPQPQELATRPRSVAQAGSSTRCYDPSGSLDRDSFPCNRERGGIRWDASFKSKNCLSMPGHSLWVLTVAGLVALAGPFHRLRCAGAARREAEARYDTLVAAYEHELRQKQPAVLSLPLLQELAT